MPKTIQELEQQNKELRLFAEELDRKIKILEQKETPKVEIKQYEDIKFFPLLKVGTLYGGIPILNTTTSLSGFNGQIFLINASGNTTPRKLVAFQIGNTTSSVVLT